MEPPDVVQAAIDAYHAHDLDLCLSFCPSFSEIDLERIGDEGLPPDADPMRPERPGVPHWCGAPTLTA